MKIFHSLSYDETLSIAEKIGEKLNKGTVVAMYGDLGVGKTAFTTGLAKGLGINSHVTSPTFALVNEYHGDNNDLYHFDMYRVTSWDDLYSTGFFDYLDTDAVLAIEWSENIDGALPDNTLCVELVRLNDNEREIRVWERGRENENLSN